MERLYTFTVRTKDKTYTTVVPEYTLAAEYGLTRKEWIALPSVEKENIANQYLNEEVIPQYVEASWSC